MPTATRTRNGKRYAAATAAACMKAFLNEWGVSDRSSQGEVDSHLTSRARLQSSSDDLGSQQVNHFNGPFTTGGKAIIGSNFNSGRRSDGFLIRRRCQNLVDITILLDIQSDGVGGIAYS